MSNILMRRLLAALIVVLGVMTYSVASAQFTYTCIIVGGVKIIVITNQNTATGSTGSGTFTAVVPPPPTGPINASYRPNQIQVTANDPVNGSINTTLDPTRQSPLSTIVTNQGAPRFPATGSLNFYANATVGGASFRSQTPLEFRSTNLSSTPPFTNETFTLNSDVVFQRVDGTGTFTLKAGSTSVTLGNNQGGN